MKNVTKGQWEAVAKHLAGCIATDLIVDVDMLTFNSVEQKAVEIVNRSEGACGYGVLLAEDLVRAEVFAAIDRRIRNLSGRRSAEDVAQAIELRVHLEAAFEEADRRVKEVARRVEAAGV